MRGIIDRMEVSRFMSLSQTLGDVYASLCKKGASAPLHLARSEGHERYFGRKLMHHKVLESSHQHLMAEGPAVCTVRRVLLLGIGSPKSNGG